MVGIINEDKIDLKKPEERRYPLRHARLDDIPVLLDIGDKLYHEGAFGGLTFDRVKVREQMEKFIVEGNAEYLALVADDEKEKPVGTLFAYAMRPMFSSEKLAVECLLYLEPEYRSSRIGFEMLHAYEYWAKQIGCKQVQAGLLDCSPHGMDKFYTKLGYEETERVYNKRMD